MQEIFKLEFHPVDGPPRRIRFLAEDGAEDLARVVEVRREGAWCHRHTDVVDYSAYSDGH